MKRYMLGAECLLKTLLAGGVDTCFMNPGTSEMQFVSALDRVAGMRSILCLFEGVCSGAADGYARIARRPAATLLHLGPGLGNGLANFHNARKARSPVVNIVGQHTTKHLQYDAPLSADIEAFARPVSGYVHTLECAGEMGRATVETIRAAYAGQVATLIVPADFSWSEAGAPGAAVQPPERPRVETATVRAMARVLRSGEPCGLLLDGTALMGAGLDASGRLAAGTGVKAFANRYAARLESGAGRFAPQRVAYFPEKATQMLAGLKHLILVESLPPVSFFGYPNHPSFLAPEDCEIHVLAERGEDGAQALAALAEECGAGETAVPRAQRQQPELPSGDTALTPDAIGRVVAALLPEDTIVSDETVSSSEPILRHLSGAAAHDLLPVTGGSIGQGLPVALGAAVAAPGRKVVTLEADGSGMYTLQSLWTMARERLDVVTVVLANRQYRILEVEIRRTGASEVGRAAREMIEIGRPVIDWVKLSEGQGVAASRATTVAELAEQFGAAVRGRGPAVIEAVIDPV